MIRSNHHLMKRGTLQAVLREAQPAVAFDDFVDFSGFCPASASVFETVFLCPNGPAFN